MQACYTKLIMDNPVVVNLNQNNQNFVTQMLATGKYRSEAEVIEEALDEMRQKKIQLLDELIAVGERQIQEGKTIEYSEEMMDQIFAEAKRKSKLNLPIKDEVKP